LHDSNDLALRISPGFSIERRRHVLPFRNPEDFERRVEGLHTARLQLREI
jgi:adenylate cyclase